VISDLTVSIPSQAASFVTLMTQMTVFSISLSVDEIE
jgi:hypothetical protein